MISRSLSAVRRAVLGAALAACFGAAAGSQVPPGAPPPLDVSVLSATPAPGSPAEARWRFGKEALAAGNGEAAIPHLLAALEFHPASPPLLFDLARACADAGARALWLERFARAAADVQGRVELDAGRRKLVVEADLAAAKALALARAQAALELARAVERCKATGKKAAGNGVLARWLTDVFLDVAADAPALLAAHAEAFQGALARNTPEVEAVAKALLTVAQGRTGTAAESLSKEDAARERAELSLAAARILRGMVRQSGYGKDLRGAPPPDLEGFGGPAAEAEAQGLAALGEPRVHSIAELEAMTPEEREAFTWEHRHPGHPGVAMSPTQRYRIETVCGFETLLQAAKDVELHHRRLAGHFGSDPFEGRPGIVRIVPEVSDLEIEGAPYWWAGGFQSGDVTVLRFAWDRISSLGRGLTHEFTHRFDFVLRPFVPAWYAEGHASWTGAHFVAATDTVFLEDFLDWGTCAHTFAEGYGAEAELRKLLAGTIEDYRDNYFAGYSLYAFLRGHPPRGGKRFAAQLARYEQNARAGARDPVGWFEKTLCDGKDGRPKDLAAFAVEWHAFLEGCYRYGDERTRDASNAWVGMYAGRPSSPETPMVLDEPTWSWARVRAEPFFGQVHAAAAARVLERAGQREGALLAWLWSLSAEGWSGDAAAAVPVLFAGLGMADEAAAAQQLAHARFPLRVAAPARLPGATRLPRTKALLDLLETTAAAQPPDAAFAASLRAERRRLGALLGVDVAAAADAALPPPPVPRALGTFGFAEDSLTDYDDRRVANLWFVTREGDVHVGRDKSQADTGGFERRAQHRNAFVRTVDWLPPGEHVLRMRIHFTTSHVAGAVILGHWRRDRSVRLQFSAGSGEYASGRSEERPELDRAWFSLQGMWERDGKLPEPALSNGVDFAQPTSSFELVLRVRGPQLLVEVDGRPRFRYTTPDGAAIEGHVGFASSIGAYRVQQPTVQRLDLAAPGAREDAVLAVGLDLERQPVADVEALLGLRVRGVQPGPVGTLVLWLPPAAEGDDVAHRLPRGLLVISKLLRNTLEYPQPWVLAVPAGTEATAVDAARKLVLETRGDAAGELPAVEHRVGAPFTGNPWVLFVDAHGVLRAAAEVGDSRLHSEVQRWARMFRAR